MFVEQVISTLPAIEHRLVQIRQKQEEDVICRKLAELCRNGWPTRTKCPSMLKPHITVSSELSVKDGLLMRGNTIVIPAELQQDIYINYMKVAKESLNADYEQESWCGG